MHWIKYILRENIEIFSKQGRDLKKGKEEKNTINQLNTELHCVFRKSLCAGTGVLERDAAVPQTQLCTAPPRDMNEALSQVPLESAGNSPSSVMIWSLIYPGVKNKCLKATSLELQFESRRSSLRRWTKEWGQQSWPSAWKRSTV